MEIKRFGYYWLDTWVLANVIQLATQDFCHKRGGPSGGHPQGCQGPRYRHRRAEE